MNWEILLAISLISYAIAVLLQRLLLKDSQSDPIAYSIVIPLCAGIILSVPLLWKDLALEKVPELWPNLILMVALYGASNVFTYNALKRTEASTFTILNASRALWSIGAAVLFLRENFSLRQAVGTGLVIVSVILISWKGQKIRLTKGEIFALLAAFAFGVEFINDAYILQHLDVYFYLPIAFVLPSLAVWMVYPKATRQIMKLLQARSLSKAIVISVLYALSAITLFLAYQVGRNAAQIAPINETSTILIVLLAMIFLSERDRLFQRLLAAGISFSGVLLIK